MWRLFGVGDEISPNRIFGLSMGAMPSEYRIDAKKKIR
jgi:hypothetical protein